MDKNCTILITIHARNAKTRMEASTVIQIILKKLNKQQLQQIIDLPHSGL